VIRPFATLFLNENGFNFFVSFFILCELPSNAQKREEEKFCSGYSSRSNSIVNGKIGPIEMLNYKLNAQEGSTPTAVAPPTAIAPEQVMRHHR